MATIKTLLGYVKGPKGDTGETGGTGPAGAAATVEAGMVNNVAYGQPARVTNVGTPHAAVFNFDIPEGRPGSIGEISGYPVNAITTQAGDFPIPNVGDTIATLAGKQAKATADAQAGLQAANTDIASLLASITLLTNNLWRSAVRDDYSMGTQLTTEQAQMIASGDFKDLPNGAYWQDGSRKIRIVDNTKPYLNKGDTEFNKPHLVLMTDDNVLKSDGSTTKYMMDANSTTGGYQGTKYRATYRAQCKKYFTDFFGVAHISSFRDLQTNASANGHASNWSWVDADVELPSEIQIYGSNIWQADGNTGYFGYNTGISYPQFALFRMAPQYITNRENYWLRDVVSSAYFAHVGDYGLASSYNASHAYVGLRPFALLI